MCKDKTVHDFHVNVYVMSLLLGRIIAIRRDILLFFEELLLHLMNIPVVLMFQNGTSFFILEKTAFFITVQINCSIARICSSINKWHLTVT